MNDHRNHLERVDVLRAAAILLVYFCHALPNMTDRHDFESLGWAGVSLFFVISGFCIHHSFLRYREKDPNAPLGRFVWSFWWRRFWRIYPPYAVLLLAAWYLQQQHSPLPSWHFWSHLLLVHNLNTASFHSILPVFWSLAIEWHFYLLYPAFLLLCQRKGLRRALLIAAVASFALRIVAAFWQDWREPFNPVVWYSPLILFFDWSLGVWLAEQRWQGKSLPTLERAALPLLLIFPFTPFITAARPFGFTVAAIAFAGVTSFYLRRSAPLNRLEQALIPLGVWSYSFYLFHRLLIGRAGYWFHYLGIPNTPSWNVLLYAVIVLLCSAVLSWICFKLLERPSIALGQKLWKRWFNPRAGTLQTTRVILTSPPPAA